MRERRHEDFPLAVFRMPLGIRLPARATLPTDSLSLMRTENPHIIGHFYQ